MPYNHKVFKGQMLYVYSKVTQGMKSNRKGTPK